MSSNNVFNNYPKYYRNSILRISEVGYVCVVTYWTKKEVVQNKINKDVINKVLTIGNLYTSNGLEYIIKNSYLCKQINYYVFCGSDNNDVENNAIKKYISYIMKTKHDTNTCDDNITTSTQDTEQIMLKNSNEKHNEIYKAQHNLLKNINDINTCGNDICYNTCDDSKHDTNINDINTCDDNICYNTIVSTHDNKHNDININELTQDEYNNIEQEFNKYPYKKQFWEYFYDHCLFCKLSKLNDVLSSLNRQNDWINELQEFNEEEVRTTKLLSESIGYCLHDTNLFRLWKRILTKINLFGSMKKLSEPMEGTNSDEDNFTKELLGVVSVLHSDGKLIPSTLTKQEKDNIPNYKILNDYIQLVCNPFCDTGTSYTYAQRLFRDNQIKNIVDELYKNKYSRRTISTTWNIETDTKSLNPPCLVLVDLKVQNNYLYITCYFRSHDLYNAYCMNIIALQQLQHNILTELNKLCNDDKNKLYLGDIMIVSNSAHVYKQDINKIISLHELDCNLDPRGYFVISINKDDNNINVKYFDSNNNYLMEFEDNKVHNLLTDIQPYISLVSHALYLGKELYKAKYCLKHDINYVQS